MAPVGSELRVSDVVIQLRAEGHAITGEDLARVSLLLHAHINPLGQYRFDLERMRRA